MHPPVIFETQYQIPLTYLQQGGQEMFYFLLEFNMASFRGVNGFKMIFPGLNNGLSIRLRSHSFNIFRGWFSQVLL
jgi:hypothetical protein